MIRVAVVMALLFVSACAPRYAGESDNTAAWLGLAATGVQMLQPRPTVFVVERAW